MSHLSKQKLRVARSNKFKVILNCVSKTEPLENERQQIYTGVKQRIMRPSLLILLLRLPLPYYPKGYRSIIEWNLEIK